MRKPILFLAVVAIATAACSSGTSSSFDPRAAVPPAHHLWTQAPSPRTSPSRPGRGHPVRRRHARRPGCEPVRPDRARPRVDVRPRRGHGVLHDRPAVRRGRQPARPGVRPGRGVRQRDDHDYPAPRDGTFAIYARRRAHAVPGDDEVLLRLGVKAREVSQRPPGRRAHVRHRHLGLDGARGPAGAGQAVAHAARRPPRPCDTVAIVDLRLRRPGRARADHVRRRRAHLSAIHGLPPDGSTNAEAGLRLGFELAADAFREGGINRVILASDGVANIGVTEPTAILAGSAGREQGIQLVTVGFGMGNYNDALMEQLADHGDGFYAYVDGLDEARTLFGEQLTSTARVRRARRQGAGRVRPRARRGVPADRLREPRPPRRGVPRPDRSSRGDRRGPRGDGPLRPAPHRRPGGLFNRPDRDRLDPVDRSRHPPRADEIALDIRPRATSSTGFERAPSASFRLDALVAAAAEVFRGSRWADGYSISATSPTSRSRRSATFRRPSNWSRTSSALDEAARIER